jgi:signal peptidase I
MDHDDKAHIEAKPAKPEKKKETTGEMLRSLFFAILIALVFRSVAFEPFHIPSGSMLSTLYKGDYIFVSKLSYGYSRYSFPLGLPLFKGRVLYTPPKRGDVVVFRLPPDPKIDYIKRVIGLPGDTIQVREGRLYINGTAVEVTYREQMKMQDNDGSWYRVRRYDETLPDGVTHTILNTRDGNRDGMTGFDSDNTAVYTVPEGHYFMMGDNRDNSEDSRYSPALGFPMGPGFVPLENIVGRADLVLLSYNTDVPFWKFWEWPDAFRNDRWVSAIH